MPLITKMLKGTEKNIKAEMQYINKGTSFSQRPQLVQIGPKVRFVAKSYKNETGE